MEKPEVMAIRMGKKRLGASAAPSVGFFSIFWPQTDHFARSHCSQNWKIFNFVQVRAPDLQLRRRKLSFFGAFTAAPAVFLIFLGFLGPKGNFCQESTYSYLRRSTKWPPQNFSRSNFARPKWFHFLLLVTVRRGAW